MIINIWWIGCKAYGNPFRSIRVVRKLILSFQEMIGNKTLVRAFKNDGKYMWDMFNPAWPSPAFNAFFENHLNEIESINSEHYSLRRLIVAITKKCPLNCAHCSEGATLNNKDILSVNDFTSIIDPMAEKGAQQLIFSGGEPLNRYQDLLSLLSKYKGKCDQWIYTSGYGLTLEKAKELKFAGLNGAAVSLDHHLESGHNGFRRNEKSYAWVLKAIANLQKAGVFVSINICPSRAYIEKGHMQTFIELAKEMDVPIVNILEPRAVGNFQFQDVELTEKHKTELKQLSEKYNFNKKYLDYPTVSFPAAYRRVKACGGGKSYLFIDYDGKMYPCPFCKSIMPSPVSEEKLCVAN